MQGFAKVTILGTLGNDAEVKTTQAGKTLVKFRIAVSESWKNGSGQRQESTVWIGANCWRNLPDWMVQKATRGAPIAVTGTLQDDSYKDKDGKTVSRLVVNVDDIEVLERVTHRGGEQRFADGSGSVQRPGAGDTDDLPFAPVEDLP